MKKMIVLFTLLIAAKCYSQNIDFNNYVSAVNNDLYNNFEGTHTYTQIITNGITGGCIQTPQLSDQAVYKAKFGWNFTQANPLKVSISAKYVVALDLQNGGDPSCRIEVQQYRASDSSANLENAFCTFYYSDIGVGSFPASSTSGIATLTDSWYKLEMVTYYQAPTLFVTVNLYNLGMNGQAAPVLVSTHSNNYNRTFPTDTGMYYQIGVKGNYTYGIPYMDNFSVTGNAATGVADISSGTDFKVSNTGQFISVENVNRNQYTFNLYNTAGQNLYTGNYNDFSSNIDISSFSSGLYFAEIVSGSKRVFLQKIIKNL